MQNTFIQFQADKIIIDQAQLTTYAIIAGALIVLLAIVFIIAKTRKKNFIKTIPTNLKEVK